MGDRMEVTSTLVYQRKKRSIDEVEKEDSNVERSLKRIKTLDQDPLPEPECREAPMELEEQDPIEHEFAAKPPTIGVSIPQTVHKQYVTMKGEKFDASKWARPSCEGLVKSIDEGKRHSLVFQQLSTDYTVASSDWFPECGVVDKYDYIPVIRTFGVTQEGNSVCHYTTGFFPYCYMEAPMARLGPTDIAKLKDFIEKRMRESKHIEDTDTFTRHNKTKTLFAGLGNKRISDIKNNVAVHSIEVVYKYSARDYHAKKTPFYKIYFTLPRYVATLRNVLKTADFRPWNNHPVSSDWSTHVKEDCANIHCESNYAPFKLLYEDNINYELRYMIDHDFTGFGWVEVPLKDTDSYTLRKTYHALTTSQIEIQTHHETAIYHKSSQEPWTNMMSKFRIMSFDIECLSADKYFPNPETAKVIQIAAYVKVYGEQPPGAFQITVNTQNKKEVVLDVAPTDTVDSIKRSIFTKEDIDVREQRLVFNGKVLDDHLTMEECGLGQGCVLVQEQKVIIRTLMETVLEKVNLKTIDSKKSRAIIKVYKEKFKRDAKRSKTTKEDIHTMAKVGFTLDGCAPLENAHVFSFKEEKDLLMAFSQFVSESDPDVLTGYNIMNFDLEFLWKRANALGIGKTFSKLTRCKGYGAYSRNTTFQSRAFGKRESFEHVIPGRICFDLLPWVQRDFKIRSYSLNSVSAKFLGDQKDDVDHTMIPVLQCGPNATDDTRSRLMKYCFKDAYLVLSLMEKLCTIVKESENCKITGIQLSMVLSRGQSIKVYRQVLSFMRDEGYIVPNEKFKWTGEDTNGGEAVDFDYDPNKLKHINDDGYEGAVVVEPKVGFYDDYVPTLDFASLYPSIMIAHNLCPTTLISEEQALKMDKNDYTKTPAGFYFVKKHVKEGIMPKVLRILLAARNSVKKQMGAAIGLAYVVLNMRQEKIKVNANSVYGFTGASVSQLYTKEVAASVTAFGREMIQTVAASVEKKFCRANGYEMDAEVLYGDTDSVMVRLRKEFVKSMTRAIEIGKEMAAYASSLFDHLNPDPKNPIIKMVWEKVLHPFLLIKKKKYAGVLWEKVEKFTKVDVKGLEVVRRETTPYVQKTMDKCLKAILVQRNIQGAVDYARKRIKKLRSGDADINELVVTKQLNGTAKDYKQKQPHVELAERMRARDPSSAPNVGDRVPFVLVKAFKGAKTCEKAEDPLYAFQNGIELDYEFYLSNHLSKPLERIFQYVESKEKLFKNTEPEKIVKKIYINKDPNKKKELITHFFTVKDNNCIKCNRVIKMVDGTNPSAQCHLCKDCLPDIDIISDRVYNQRATAASEYNAIYKHCQDCQGTTGDVMCNEKECKVFFFRNRMKRDLDECIENELKIDMTKLDW